MKKFVNKLRLEFLTLVFYHWYEVARMIIAELDRKNRPKTSLELMQEFEAEHKRDIDEVRQRVEPSMALSTGHTDAFTTNGRYDRCSYGYQWQN